MVAPGARRPSIWIDDMPASASGQGGCLVIGCAERPPDRGPAGPGVKQVWSLGAIVPAYAQAPAEVRVSIARAIDERGVTDIAICGHVGCVALRGILTGVANIPDPQVRAWLAHAERVQSIVAAHYLDRPAAALFELALQHHVLVQLEGLLTHPAVTRAVEAGQVKLHGWIVDPHAGTRWAYDAHAQQFSLVQTEGGRAATREGAL